MQIIAQQLIRVRQSLRAAEKKYQRAENSVKLLAVSKTRSVAEILQAIEQGQYDFGENYLQEAKSKLSTLQDESICWHFIGPLQSNKARIVAENFGWIHSVDRNKIAQRLSDLRPLHLPALNVCIQLNISEEATKSGTSTDELITLAKKISSLPRIKLRGLMALPAPTNDFSEQREGFRHLRKIYNELQNAGFDIDTLSMGTTNDMEAAVAEGSTIVRIGTALFGPRL
jgi:PLP dependent protein